MNKSNSTHEKQIGAVLLIALQAINRFESAHKLFQESQESESPNNEPALVTDREDT